MSKFGLPNQAFFVILATAVLSKKEKKAVFTIRIQYNVMCLCLFQYSVRGTKGLPGTSSGEALLMSSHMAR